LNHVGKKVKKELAALLKKEKEIHSEFKTMLLNFLIEKEDPLLPFAELCVLHYEEYAKEFDKEIYKVAAAIELLVLSFDMIDDIQDGDSSHSWAANPALGINSAIAMLVLAAKIIRESSCANAEVAVGILETYALQSIDGQQLDLKNQARDEASCLQMIERKSGSLTAMSCLIGTALATGKAPASVEQYGRYIGAIHQLKNDISDLKNWDKKNDILNRRYSLPIIYLLAIDDDTSAHLRNFYEEEVTEIVDKKRIQQALADSGAIRYALFFIHNYQGKAERLMNEAHISETAKNKILLLMK
jgi:competence protein ComQ